MQPITVKANKIFLGAMSLLLFLVGFGGFLLGLSGEELFSTWYITLLCILMIFMSGIAFYMYRFTITLRNNEIIIKQWKSKIMSVNEIKYIDFSFASAKNGSYFIALMNGESQFIIRKVFSPLLFKALIDFCEENNIEMIDKNKGEDKDYEKI